MDRATNRVSCCILQLERSTKHLKLNKQSAHIISLVTQSFLSYDYPAVSARARGLSEDLPCLKGFGPIHAGVSGVIAFYPIPAGRYVSMIKDASVNPHEVDTRQSRLIIILGSSYLQNFTGTLTSSIENCESLFFGRPSWPY